MYLESFDKDVILPVYLESFDKDVCTIELATNGHKVHE